MKWISWLYIYCLYILLCTPCTMGICKNDGAHCRNTKVPGKVQFELVNSKHAPSCNERSCDIVIVLPDFVIVLLDFVVVLLDFVVVLPDFVVVLLDFVVVLLDLIVESNKLCEHVSAQTIAVCSHLLFAQQPFHCLGPAKFGLSAQKRQSPSTKHPSHPLPCSQALPFCYKK